MGNRRTLVGQVVSNKMAKTIVVKVETRRQHPLYKKHVVYSKKFKAHDETNTCKVGDVVKLRETRPLSKEKRWRLVEILTRSGTREPSPVTLKKLTDEPLSIPVEKEGSELISHDPDIHQTQSS